LREGEKIFVVGGGPSLRNFDFRHLSSLTTIVVNSSIFYVPNPDYFITMDYTWFHKSEIEYGKPCPYFKSKAKKFFVVAFCGDRLGKFEHGVIDKKYNLKYDLRVVDEVIFSSRYGGIGTSFEDFRSASDSGYCALQLAIVLGYKEIYLLGMDFVTIDIGRKVEKVSFSHLKLSRLKTVNSPVVERIKHFGYSHFYEQVSKNNLKAFNEKLGRYVSSYSSAAQQIKEKTECKVFSCSPISKLNQYFEYRPLEECLK